MRLALGPRRVRVVTVIGTRPQLIKIGALQPVLRRRVDEVFVDTGQHWDDNMAGSFFAELGLARPDYSLDTGGGSHAQQTAAMLLGIEPILVRERPDAVVVVGDTNSTLAAALAAAKLDLPVAHVEAGLRAFDRRIPEELNRLVVDRLSRLLFAPTPTAVAEPASRRDRGRRQPDRRSHAGPGGGCPAVHQGRRDPGPRSATDSACGWPPAAMCS